MIAEVLVELKTKRIDQTYSYLIPFDLERMVEVGKRVLVPFGNQKLEGFVLNIKKEISTNYKLKSIISVIDINPVLNDELLELGKYISKKTLCNLITSYQTMLPSALKAKNGTSVNKKYVTYLKLQDKNFVGKNDKQKLILDLFIDSSDILKNICSNISVSAVKTLLKSGILEELRKEQYRLDDNEISEVNNIVLTSEQEQVLKKIEYNRFKSYLIHGVTGSGKTEVYMNIIDNVIELNKEAIVLVPEISLTPQIVNTFKKRFGSKIAILHSRLSNGEKYDEWRKIERKEVSIVIGARSAIFAPFTKLGVIIIDEEHSQTYKQENNPKYSAIDIALWRGKKYNIPVILGSATPSIESYTRSITGAYELCSMNNRVNNNYPSVTLVDMREEIKKGNRIISQILKDKITEKISKNEQVILLLNRRGYSTITTCKDCGYTGKCPNCDIPLTYHQSSNKMECHYCGYSIALLNKCPECNSKNISNYGMGTEKLEQYISSNFEGAKVIRMDVDTTTTKGSHEKIINSFKNKEFNILIGTQMISKGLDFPLVTLVGVVNGDASLNIPDFRSAERTFQLLNQVAGRAGRADLTGEVIIQGFNIDHYSIVKASNNDYIGFYNEEMNIRKILKYSPYYNLCLIKIKSNNYEEAIDEAKKISTHLKNKKMAEVMVLGPSAGTIPKMNNIYTMQVIIKFKKTDLLMEELKFIRDHYRISKVNVEIDINPVKL